MSIQQKTPFNVLLIILAAAVLIPLFSLQADAQHRRGGRGSVHRGGNVNVNVNRNAHRGGNVNVNRNVNVNVNNNNRRGRYYHPVATGVAIGAAAAVTAAVIGSVVYSLPPTGCTTVIRNGISYSQCGTVWYEPRYSGNNVTYVVVNPM